MNNVLSLSVDIINDIPQGEDKDFAIVRVQGLSNGKNSHGLNISEEVLKRDANTVLRKLLVAKMSKDWSGKLDATNHTLDEIIIGYIPHDAEIRFVENKSGNGIFWEVDAVVSKLYSNGGIDIFRRDIIKDVSVEMSVNYGNEEETNISSYCIHGITILGSGINPSCMGANAEIIKFSEEKANEFYHRNNSVNELKRFAEERKSSLATKKSKNEVIEKPTENKEEGGEKMSEETKELEQPTETEDMEEKVDEAKLEEDEAKVDEDSEKDDDEDETEEMSSDANVDVSAITELLQIEAKKNEELSKDLQEKDDKIVKYEEELIELRKFKEKVEEEIKLSEIAKVLSKCKDKVSPQEFAKFEEDAKVCKFADINEWKTNVLTTLGSKLLQFSSEEEETEVTYTRMSMPKEDKQEKSLWERL